MVPDVDVDFWNVKCLDFDVVADADFVDSSLNVTDLFDWNDSRFCSFTASINNWKEIKSPLDQKQATNNVCPSGYQWESLRQLTVSKVSDLLDFVVSNDSKVTRFESRSLQWIVLTLKCAVNCFSTWTNLEIASQTYKKCNFGFVSCLTWWY